MKKNMLSSAISILGFVIIASCKTSMEKENIVMIDKKGNLKDPSAKCHPAITDQHYEKAYYKNIMNSMDKYFNERDKQCLLRQL